MRYSFGIAFGLLRSSRGGTRRSSGGGTRRSSGGGTGSLSAGVPRRTGGQAARGTRQPRPGISLLEVLIAVGVLCIGLLAVAAMIPLAHFELLEASKADRSAAAGEALLEHARVQGMLDPTAWRDVFWRNPSAAVDWTWRITDPDRDASTPDFFNNQQSYVIDPLFIATNPQDAGAWSDPALERIRRLPYWAPGFDPASPQPNVRMYMPALTMQRVTLNQIAYLTATTVDERIARQLAVSQRGCTWQDDLRFPVPANPDDRPRQVMLCSSDAGPVSAAVPARAEDFATGAVPLNLTAQTRETAGRYTWMVTVTPEVGDYGSGSIAQAYSVSVAVFHQRDLSLPPLPPNPPDLNLPPPPERTVMASILGSGHGGGDVRLVAPLEPYGPHIAEYVDVKEGEWLLLAGTVMNSLNPASFSHTVFRWYRIVGVGELEPDFPTLGGFSRVVTLEGPDWDARPDPSGPRDEGWCLRYNPLTGSLPSDASRFTDMNGDTIALDVQACLFDGIVGVSTTTVELE